MKNLFFLTLILISFNSFSQLPRVIVEGNKFVIEDNGEEIIFHGLNTSDPNRLNKAGKWNKDYFQEMKNWGANIARFPIHPSDLHELGEKNYFQLLEKGIGLAEDAGIYVILDWHVIGNLHTEMFQQEMHNTTKKETYNFWRKIAAKFGDNPTVAFYEFFNEPTTYNLTLGEITWEEWKEINEDLITIVRANGGKGIPLIAGFNWAYDLTPVRLSPIGAEGIAYVSHPYPQKVEKPWKEKWERDWGFVKENYPLILTEIGYSLPEERGAHIPVIDNGEYGPAITNYADENCISYVVWVFDPLWAPRLFTDWNYTPSAHGAFFKQKLQSYFHQQPN